MPELPEVETVRSGLAPLVVGSTVTDVEVLRASCVRLQAGGQGEFSANVLGMVLGAVARRGKFLWFPLVLKTAEGARHGGVVVPPTRALSAHLGMSGQFRVFDGEPPEPHPHCRVRLHLDAPGGGRVLDFVDQRTFGYVLTEPMQPTSDGFAGGHGSTLPTLPRTVAHIARDALDPALDDARVIAGLRRGSRCIKHVLLDQTVVSGIGNIYADEALWAARIHPRRPAQTISAAQARNVLAAVRDVMAKALARGGTSFDGLYVDVNGQSGYFSRNLAAYGRAGKPCHRCGAPLAHDRIGGRSTHWCPRCQRSVAWTLSRD